MGAVSIIGVNTQLGVRSFKEPNPWLSLFGPAASSANLAHVRCVAASFCVEVVFISKITSMGVLMSCRYADEGHPDRLCVRAPKHQIFVLFWPAGPDHSRLR